MLLFQFGEHLPMKFIYLPGMVNDSWSLSSEPFLNSFSWNTKLYTFMCRSFPAEATYTSPTWHIQVTESRCSKYFFGNGWWLSIKFHCTILLSPCEQLKTDWKSLIGNRAFICPLCTIYWTTELRVSSRLTVTTFNWLSLSIKLAWESKYRITSKLWLRRQICLINMGGRFYLYKPTTNMDEPSGRIRVAMAVTSLLKITSLINSKFPSLQTLSVLSLDPVAT